MRHIFEILAVLLLLTVTKSYGQTNDCDTIYNNSETIPQYENDFKGLSDYLIKELVPIIANCMERDTDIIVSLYIILTIDSDGRVIDATFPKHNLSSLCKADLKKKLLTMDGWTAGQKDGRPVCSKFNWPIGCLKWK